MCYFPQVITLQSAVCSGFCPKSSYETQSSSLQRYLNMMRSKNLITLSAALALAAFGQAASACAISAWSSATGVTVAANTGLPSAGFARTSGACSLKTLGPSQFVSDTSPGSANSYKARFYVKADAGAAGAIFKARNSGGTNIITITQSATGLAFNVNGAATQPAAIPTVAGRWYVVEMDWAAGAAASFRVQGNGGLATTGVTSTSSAAPAADVIANVQLGNIDAAGAGVITFDEFDSRRTTAPGRLCRGDANNSSAAAPVTGLLTGGDAQAIFAEVGAVALATGQPDYNQNGTVTGGDAQQIFNLITNSLDRTCGAQ
jgi:hypothetical protein